MSTAAPTPGTDPNFAAAAAALDTAAAPRTQLETQLELPAPVVIDWHREARDFWKIIAMLQLRFPRLAPVFTDANIENLAAGWAPVLERHKLHAGILGIYLGCAAVTLPIAADAYKAVRLDRIDEKAADAAVAPDISLLHTRA